MSLSLMNLNLAHLHSGTPEQAALAKALEEWRDQIEDAVTEKLNEAHAVQLEARDQTIMDARDALQVAINELERPEFDGRIVGIWQALDHAVSETVTFSEACKQLGLDIPCA